MPLFSHQEFPLLKNAPNENKKEMIELDRNAANTDRFLFRGWGGGGGRRGGVLAPKNLYLCIIYCVEIDKLIQDNVNSANSMYTRALLY
jgi:hypothetical protein